MKKFIYTLFFLTFILETKAQFTYFPTSGTITYERKFHLQNYLKRQFLSKAKLDAWDNLSVDYLVKNGPTEIITKHTLKFYDQETVFETIKEDYPSNYRNAMGMVPFFADTKTYTNHTKREFSKLLPFGGEELILKDTIPTIKWKYTDEYRTVAGYDCRRANGVIQDSIYVVAFFTNQIAIPAGPELIQGLPGTILGVSIPSLNVNMFATQVQLTNESVSANLSKKKKVDIESRESLIKRLKTTVYSWYDDEEMKKQLSKVFF